jgi:hypothetical protein
MRESIVESIVGPVEWMDNVSGYCRCPGIGLHTTANGRRDTIVYIDGAPTIFCFHSSCQATVEKANLELRRAMAKGNPALFRATLKQVRALRQREREKQQFQELKSRARESLPVIPKQFAWSPADMSEDSPIRLLEDPASDWRLLLGLFDLAAVVWIGAVTDSCNDQAASQRKTACSHHFRQAAEWLNEPEAPGQFTCPSLFKAEIHSRSNENVTTTPFLVVESDTLSKQEIGAVFRWLSQIDRLRAIVDTAGRSLHGWFNRPDPEVEDELRIILPQLGCDPALFKPSQPCRLPGAKRDGRLQKLLYLDVEATP